MQRITLRNLCVSDSESAFQRCWKTYHEHGWNFLGSCTDSTVLFVFQTWRVRQFFRKIIGLVQGSAENQSARWGAKSNSRSGITRYVHGSSSLFASCNSFFSNSTTSSSSTVTVAPHTFHHSFWFCHLQRNLQVRLVRSYFCVEATRRVIWHDQIRKGFLPAAPYTICIPPQAKPTLSPPQPIQIVSGSEVLLPHAASSRYIYSDIYQSQVIIETETESDIMNHDTSVIPIECDFIRVTHQCWWTHRIIEIADGHVTASRPG